LQGSFNERREPEAPVAQDQSLLESTQWNSGGQLPNSFGWEQDEKKLDTANFAGSWPLSPKEEELSSAPDWLSMLTQGDRRQMSGQMPAIQPSVQQPQAASLPIAQPPIPQEPIAKQPASAPSVENMPVVPVAKEEEPALAPFASGSADDEEESFFGP